MPVKHALVVDDSKSARMMLQRMLNKMNVESEAVESAEAALLFLDKSQPDVIFMDHMMPGMNGLEATQMIKANPKTATIPTIMYTSKEGEDYFNMAKSHGAEGVLAKPANQEAVMSVIESLSELAANDDDLPVTDQANIPLIEIDKLVQKHLKIAIAKAKAEITAGLDSSTQQLQNAQAHEIKLAQRHWLQRYESLEKNLNNALEPKVLFKNTRPLNQRLATLVAEKTTKKAAADLNDIINVQNTETKESLAKDIAEIQQLAQTSKKQAVFIGVLTGIISALATSAAFQFLI